MGIRKATKEHAKQLSEYMLKELKKPNKKFPTPMIEKLRENAKIKNMKKQFNNPNLIGFVLIENKELKGFIVGYKENKNQSMIHYVTAKNLSLRKDLLESFIAESRKRGLKKVTADSFEFMKSNKFFIDSGFKFIKKEKVAPGLEMLWYKLEL